MRFEEEKDPPPDDNRTLTVRQELVDLVAALLLLRVPALVLRNGIHDQLKLLLRPSGPATVSAADCKSV